MEKRRNLIVIDVYTHNVTQSYNDHSRIIGSVSTLARYIMLKSARGGRHSSGLKSLSDHLSHLKHPFGDFECGRPFIEFIFSESRSRKEAHLRAFVYFHPVSPLLVFFSPWRTGEFLSTSLCIGRSIKLNACRRTGHGGILMSHFTWDFSICIAPRFLCRTSAGGVHMCRFWSEMRRNCTQNCCMPFSFSGAAVDLNLFYNALQRVHLLIDFDFALR